MTLGHVTVDVAGEEGRLGGAAAFAAVAASRLGLEVGMLTSAGPDFPFWAELEAIEVHYREADRTTEFENRHEGGAREQRVGAVASPLVEADLAGLRPRLREDAAVLYCPVVHELELPLVRLTPRGLAGLAPQGFFRRWDGEGRVGRRDWPGAVDALGGVDVVCMSEEDAEHPAALAETFPGRAFVITRGEAGCRVYSGGGADVYTFPAVPAAEIDPTGAGDVFAVCLLVALREGQTLPQAIGFASAAAALSVEGIGLGALPTRADVEAKLGSEAP